MPEIHHLRKSWYYCTTKSIELIISKTSNCTQLLIVYLFPQFQNIDFVALQRYRSSNNFVLSLAFQVSLSITVQRVSGVYPQWISSFYYVSASVLHNACCSDHNHQVALGCLISARVIGDILVYSYVLRSFSVLWFKMILFIFYILTLHTIMTVRNKQRNWYENSIGASRQVKGKVNERIFTQTTVSKIFVPT